MIMSERLNQKPPLPMHGQQQVANVDHNIIPIAIPSLRGISASLVVVIESVAFPLKYHSLS
jgi:hypothetical protein